ncbi:MAG: hypothetical protein IIA89_06160 [Chloroflexi bacterium]|nr:hypothetical protein [Chloroflexota bacterium]
MAARFQVVTTYQYVRNWGLPKEVTEMGQGAVVGYLLGKALSEDPTRQTPAAHKDVVHQFDKDGVWAEITRIESGNLT